MKNKQNSSFQRGFTLLELMMVVVILGVLSIVAVTSYNKYIQRSRMQDAVAFLMDIKLKQESHFQIYSQYVDTGNTENSFYPDPFPPDMLPRPWLITCPYSNPADKLAGWCTLGARPASDATYYRYITIGWQPGDGNPPTEYIKDPTRRWWFARAKSPLDKSGTLELELRLSSQIPSVIEIWP
jgi:prepilin-type N-terminal cleavage/methylation domain-containing protein